jgi:hypothetical protein
MTMSQVQRLFLKWKRIVLIPMAFVLSACPLTVNLNVATDKPIALYLVIDKPIEVKLGADVAITKLPPIQTDASIGFSRRPSIKAKP